MQPMTPMHDLSKLDPAGLPARNLSAAEFVAELDALISELESVREGSQAIDVRIHHGFHVLGGFGEDMASILIKEGVSWPTVQATLDEIVPAYSTSLDAALQGEDIVFSIRSAKGRRWGAMQRTSSGGEALAWAATEPLARRLAALKARQADLKASLDETETQMAQLDTPPPVDERTAPDLVAKEDDQFNGAGHDQTPFPEAADQERAPAQEPPEEAAFDNTDQQEQDWKILF